MLWKMMKWENLSTDRFPIDLWKIKLKMHLMGDGTVMTVAEFIFTIEMERNGI